MASEPMPFEVNKSGRLFHGPRADSNSATTKERTLFARVTTLEGGDAAKLEESIRLAQEQILPRARQMEGWKGVISLADRSSGDGLLITLWESEETMKASAEQARGLRAESEETGGGHETAVRGFEVMVLET